MEMLKKSIIKLDNAKRLQSNSIIRIRFSLINKDLIEHGNVNKISGNEWLE